MHVRSGKLQCTWELDLPKKHLVFILLTEAEVSAQQVVQRELQQNQIALPTALEHRQRGSRDVTGCLATAAGGLVHRKRRQPQRIGRGPAERGASCGRRTASEEWPEGRCHLRGRGDGWRWKVW